MAKPTGLFLYQQLPNPFVQTGQAHGGSPGLVVMRYDSCSRGCGCKSQRHILDGYFFTLICCKNCSVCLKRLEKTKKRPGLAHFNYIQETYFKSNANNFWKQLNVILKQNVFKSIVSISDLVSRRLALKCLSCHVLLRPIFSY